MSDETDRTFLSVMLIVSDAVAAVGWYKTALGASELWDLGGVAGLHVQGAPFFVHEAVPGKTKEPSPTDVGLTTTRIELFVEEPRHFIDRAAEAGAAGVEPPIDHKTPWGTHRQEHSRSRSGIAGLSGRSDAAGAVHAIVAGIARPPAASVLKQRRGTITLAISEAGSTARPTERAAAQDEQASARRPTRQQRP